MIKLLDYRLDKKKLLTAGHQLSLDEIKEDNFFKNIQKMKEILKEDGVGLAATQVDWPVQLFMLCVDSDTQTIEPEVFINPVIIKTSKVEVKGEEGCLSFPGLFLKIKRPIEIEWVYQTLDGQKKESRATGFYARAIQHEIDHLNGKVFIQKASPAQQLKVKKWLKS